MRSPGTHSWFSRISLNNIKHVLCHYVVIYEGFRLVFAELQAGPACKPSRKPATAARRVALGHARRSTSPMGAWSGLYPMKSKLTEQAAVV